MQYQQIITKIYREVASIPDDGKPASYIPELARISSGKFGVFLQSQQNEGCGVGDFGEKFFYSEYCKGTFVSFCF
jgi:glutaminase